MNIKKNRVRIYFDNAATTQVDPAVIEVMTKVLSENFGNPSSIHSEGRKARSLIEDARKVVANSLNASIGEIFFTSGGTESNNMAIKCSIRDLGVTRIITSPTEHHCVLHTIKKLNPDTVKVDFLDVDAKGRFDLKQLEDFLATDNEKTMVSLMHSNNEIGTMIDLDEISEICQKHSALFHTDTVQTIGYFPIDVSKTKISFLAGSSHKFHGPKGCGFIYINGENQIKPFIDGGSQERDMRGGTENIHGIVGLAKALQDSCENMAERTEYILELKQYFMQKLIATFNDISFNGDFDGAAHYKVLNVSFPPSPKSELLLLNLDIAGVSASGGSACISGAEKGSHVADAIKSDPLRKNVRFSFSHHNTKEEVDFVIEKLKSIIPEKLAIAQ
jgi:cysteine desulfurase